MRTRFTTIAKNALWMIVYGSLLAATLQAQAIRTDSGFTSNRISGSPCLDCSSSSVAIGFTVNFYGTNYSNLYVNSHGSVTFGLSLPEGYVPEVLTGNGTKKIIVAFFADNDMEANGSHVTYGTSMINGRRAFGVNYLNQGYFKKHADKLNSYQIVLIDRSDTGTGNFDIEFNYGGIAWEAGDEYQRGRTGICTSGDCKPAAAGFSNGLSGSANRSFQLAGSLVAGAFLDSNPNGLRRRTRADANSPDSGVPGRIILQARNGEIATGPTVSQVGPSSAPAGSGPVNLTITGTGFAPGAVVRWTNGQTTVNLSNVQVTSTTQITAQIPANLLTAAGTAQIVVANPTGSPSPAVTFTITAPSVVAVNLRLSSTPSSLSEQPGINLSLTSPYTSALNGALSLTFTPNAGSLPNGYMDPAVRFASGGATTLNFTIPAGQVNASIPNNGVFSQGTVAGVIAATLTALGAGTVSVLPAQRPSTTVTVNRIAPVITPSSVRVLNPSATGMTVEVQGYSTTRELSSATFTFTAASGSTLEGTSTFTVPLNSATWFDSTDGRSNGSRFSLQVPFTFSGDPAAIGSVSVTLTNSIGASSPVSGGR